MTAFNTDTPGGAPGRPEGIDEQGRPVRVVIADDAMVVRRLVAEVLKSAGYSIVGEAHDGKSAAALFKFEKPDLVILDVNMPIMDGLQALKEIIKTDPSAKVVMLTSQAERRLVTEIIQAGAKGYIVKPLQKEPFLEKLRQVRGVTRE